MVSFTLSSFSNFTIAIRMKRIIERESQRVLEKKKEEAIQKFQEADDPSNIY